MPIVRAVRTLQAGEASTVAIVGRTDDECRDLHAALATAGIEASLIHSGLREYRGGLSVLPVYLTKGLEFDAVLIVDVDPHHYQRTPQDAKLLYVGCTRALHQLWLLYNDEPSPLIAGMDASLYAEGLALA